MRRRQPRQGPVIQLSPRKPSKAVPGGLGCPGRLGGTAVLGSVVPLALGGGLLFPVRGATADETVWQIPGHPVVETALDAGCCSNWVRYSSA